MQLLSKHHFLGTQRVTVIGGIFCIGVPVDQARPVFEDWILGRLVVSELRALDAEGLTHTLAWVIMPDRLQWLVQLGARPLATVMCRLKSRSSLSVNEQRQACGRLWAAGYEERLLDAADDPKAIARQMVTAPQRAGLVKRTGDYPLWDAVWL